MALKLEIGPSLGLWALGLKSTFNFQTSSRLTQIAYTYLAQSTIFFSLPPQRERYCVFKQPALLGEDYLKACDKALVLLGHFKCSCITNE